MYPMPLICQLGEIGDEWHCLLRCENTNIKDERHEEWIQKESDLLCMQPQSEKFKCQDFWL